MTDEAECFAVDAEGEYGTGPGTAAVLESVAETLRESPDGYRCDFELVIEEREAGGESA